MLPETGERFSPQTEFASIAYEHLHRYAFAETLAIGKRVLDLGSGEGYGSNMLARSAALVVGVDRDPGAVHHASSTYQRGNLRFVQGNVQAVPLAGRAFDLVTTFEVLEHVEEQDKLLTEAQRLMVPDGVLLVSTPNRRLQADRALKSNPFHLRELYFDELWQLLSSRFAHVTVLGQSLVGGSLIWDLSGTRAEPHEAYVRHAIDGYEMIAEPKRSANYFIAVASNNAAAAVGACSLLLDEGDDRGKQLQALTDKHVSAYRDLERAVLAMQKTQVGREQELQAVMADLTATRSALAIAEQHVHDLAPKLAAQEHTLGRLRRTLLYRAYRFCKRTVRALKRWLRAATRTSA